MGSPYQSQSASGYNSSPPPDDGTTTSSNKITWAGIKTKLADSIKTCVDAINSALRTALNVTPSTTSVNYTTIVGDHLTTIECSGTITISLGDAATMVAQSMGYSVTLHNKGSGVVTAGVATNTNKLNGNTNGTMALGSGQSATFTVAQSGTDYEVTGVAGFAPIILTGAAGTNTATAAAPGSVRSLYAGMVVSFTPANTNTGATTLNITPSGGSALTAINVFNDGAACVAGELKASVPILLQYDGTQFNTLGRRVFKQPTRQTLGSGSGTYNTPANATRIRVRMVGAGSGGNGSGGAPGTPGAGGDTTFGTSLLTAPGGAAGSGVGPGGGGIAATINSPAVGYSIPSSSGHGGGQNAVANVVLQGGAGAASFFGGAGKGGPGNTAGGAAQPNSGSGGGGAGAASAANSGAGGDCGAFIEAWIITPSATYAYAVGASGAAAAGGNGGGAGAAGIIIVDEFYD